MPTTGDRSRLLAVSDIHGHQEGLLALLGQANYDPQRDRLFLLGDYIDTDPSTWGTLSTIYDLTKAGAQALPGNLELRLLDTCPNEVPASIRQWLHTLPPYSKEGDFLFVHAGFRPGLPLERQTMRDMTEIREAFWGQPPSGEQTVVFGHTPTYKLGAAPGAVWLADRRLGIDTGAKHGLRLTLVDLSGNLTYSCSTASVGQYGDFCREPLPELRARRCL